MDLNSHSHPDLSPDDLRRRLKGLSTLLEVTRELAAQIDPDATLQSITQGACLALDCDRASLYQYDPQRDELFTRVVTELEIGEIRHGLDRGITGDVARTRQLANVPDPSQDARWNFKVDRATGYQTRNILCGPVTSLHDGSLLGVLQLLNKAEGSFDDFDESLLLAFSRHAAVALDRSRMIRELQRTEAVQASLSVAREIHRGFIPSKLPDIPGYEVATWCFPNEAVGGDYCDVFQLPDGHVALVIADVTGHGIGPSLIMATVRAALRTVALEHSSPQRLMQLLGRALADDLKGGRFITMLIAALHAEANNVDYVNAGHGPAIHYHHQDDTFTQLDATDVPLGVLDEMECELGQPVAMQPGDLLLSCTDGIVEATDAAGDQFGQQRLQAAIRAHKDLPLQALVQQIASEVEAFMACDHPEDDLTILALRRNPDA